MTYFAEIDPDTNLVKRVIVAEQDQIDTGKWGDPKNWIQTSYNTHEGVHKEGKTPLRKNYAGIGYKYDNIRDAFIPPKRFDSFVLNEEKGIYEPPIEKPKDGKNYNWNEETLSWELTKSLP